MCVSGVFSFQWYLSRFGFVPFFVITTTITTCCCCCGGIAGRNVSAVYHLRLSGGDGGCIVFCKFRISGFWRPQLSYRHVPCFCNQILCLVGLLGLFVFLRNL